MKNKIVFKSQKDFVKWVTVSNMFAKSRIMPMVALKQFNSLKANQRTNIKKAFEEYDQKRRIKIPKGEIDSAWTISVMVDAHIIATEYNVDGYMFYLVETYRPFLSGFGIFLPLIPSYFLLSAKLVPGNHHSLHINK